MLYYGSDVFQKMRFSIQKLITEDISAQGAVLDKNPFFRGGVLGCHLKAPNNHHYPSP